MCIEVNSSAVSRYFLTKNTDELNFVVATDSRNDWTSFVIWVKLLFIRGFFLIYVSRSTSSDVLILM